MSVILKILLILPWVYVRDFAISYENVSLVTTGGAPH